MSGEESSVCFACLKQFHPAKSSSSSVLAGSLLFTKFISFARDYLRVDASVSNLSQNQDDLELCDFCSRRVASICQLYDALYALERRLSTRLEELAALMKQSRNGNQNELQFASRTNSVMNLRKEIVFKCFEKCELLTRNRECHEKVEPDEDDEATSMEVDIKSEVENSQDDGEDGDNLDDGDEEDSLSQTKETENKEEDERGEDSSCDDNFIPSSGDRDSSSSLEADCSDKEWSPPKDQANPKRRLTKKKLTSTPNVANDGSEPPPTKRQKGKDKDPVVCEICGASCVGRKAFQFHMSYHHRGPSWICDACGKTFRLKSDLRKHEVVHTGERKFKCHLCPSQYTANRALKQHLVRTHGKEKGQEKTPGEGSIKIKCEYPSCSASFFTESELRSHIEQIHSKNEDGNSWMCKLCGKVFANQQRLTRHDLVHNQVKNHICTVCNREFTFLHNLQKHLKAVHLKQRFPCTQPGCDKNYGCLSNLSEHLRKKHGIYSAKYRAKQDEKLGNDPSHPGRAE